VEIAKLYSSVQSVLHLNPKLTQPTLHFASRAKIVVNNPITNQRVDDDTSMLKGLHKELQQKQQEVTTYSCIENNCCSGRKLQKAYRRKTSTDNCPRREDSQVGRVHCFSSRISQKANSRRVTWCPTALRPFSIGDTLGEHENEVNIDCECIQLKDLLRFERMKVLQMMIRSNIKAWSYQREF
jgi:hypothetical protein